MRFALVLAAAALALVARADLKAVVKVDVEGGPKGAGGSVLTVVQSGKRIRVERSDKPQILLADGDRRYVLDTAAKTYYIPTEKASALTDSASSTLKITTTSEKKTILGLAATRLDLKGNVEFSGTGGARRGRRPPGGGLSIKIDGTLWSATDVPGYALTDVLGDRGATLAPLTQRLDAAGLILSGRISAEPPSRLSFAVGTITISFETISIDEAPLAPSIFDLPANYKKVEPPTRKGTR